MGLRLERQHWRILCQNKSLVLWRTGPGLPSHELGATTHPSELTVTPCDQRI